MENIDLKVDGDILTLKIDLSKELGESKSGKSIIVASTRGNKRIEDYEKKKIMLGVNCYIRKPKEE
ncbi:MAG: hypothetical protein GF329_15855 [Candidatus Lokiarchaeota archaeon]|nr:hypothetical protein [Candidatus Lokiarchaeota archaeon]